MKLAHKSFRDDKELFLDEENGIVYRNAVIMSILQIGEIANSLSDEFIKSHSDVPWRDIIRMRHIAVHHYYKLEYETVWNTSKQRVPELADKIRAILDELEREEQEDKL
ncbi:MAG: DUF86 domain-containing protein [Synergistaceae bacterium]|nr:DUF86 domain-containing protein [Synergistaceae bacterium]MBQ3627169.1 DUF86 domain-containing protein [Synergistaceae bacterium]MBQ7570505.1 DUF86 domain-containing protein [Synergistaceae bacterium]MBQ9896116.1 DUF86 domain-containing protein [Synergistaceae bacterium]MBR0221397.1 DUF86 domain-containing protein [Synergistaceae bacterium]